MIPHNEKPNPWTGIETRQNGVPFLLRIRRLQPDPRFSTLFVVTWNYSDSGNLLPSPKFYEKLEKFEKQVDSIEHKQFFNLVASETGGGKTRYYFYTNSVDAMADFLREAIAEEEPVEFAADDDAEWQEYRRIAILIA